MCKAIRLAAGEGASAKAAEEARTAAQAEASRVVAEAKAKAAEEAKAAAEAAEEAKVASLSRASVQLLRVRKKINLKLLRKQAHAKVTMPWSPTLDQQPIALASCRLASTPPSASLTFERPRVDRPHVSWQPIRRSERSQRVRSGAACTSGAATLAATARPLPPPTR